MGTRPCLPSRRYIWLTSGKPEVAICAPPRAAAGSRGGRCNKLHLTKGDGGTSSSLKAIVGPEGPPPLGKALPSLGPIPIVGGLSASSSTGGSRRLNVHRRSLNCSYRMLASFAKAKEAAPVALFCVSPLLLPALGGSPASWAVVAASSLQFPDARP